MITKLVDRMIGQEILESENRDEYIYALTQLYYPVRHIFDSVIVGNHYDRIAELLVYIAYQLEYIL